MVKPTVLILLTKDIEAKLVKAINEAV